jgi:LysR family hydrogen peroxide-inducible transcriptional activator
MVSIKQLRYFQAVVRHGHFGRAAAACAITQPALSMQVQALEKELGLQLFERTTKGIVLTDGGREIARRAERILTDVRELGEYARHHATTLSGTLHLGVIPTIAPYALPPLLPLLAKDYPELELNIRETQTKTLIDLLIEGTLDLLFLALPVEHPDIRTLPLFEDRFLLATPIGHRTKRRIHAAPELFEDDRLLLLEEGHCLRDQALMFCNLSHVDNVNVLGASSLSTIVQMVANGMGLTLLPEISLEIEAQRSRIKVVKFEKPEPSRTLGLAWRATSPRAREFEELGGAILASRRPISQLRDKR